MSYYRLYGNQLPSSSMRPPSSTNNSIKSDSAVRSPNAQPLATSQTINSLSNIGNNSTIHPPGDHNTDPTNFRPTPNVSSVIDDGIHGGYSTEVAGICDQISRLAQEMPTVEEEGQYIPITGMNEPKISDNPMYDPNQRLTPAKFTAPHVKAIFSARGLFAKIDAKSPLDGQSGNLQYLRFQTSLKKAYLYINKTSSSYFYINCITYIESLQLLLKFMGLNQF